jgi:CubicO group peptidase (beta-lactamase class C family)
MAFTCFNRNIPEEAHQRINAMGPAGVQAFTFAPGGGWVIAVNGGYFARGIPDECFQKLGEFIGAGHRIRVIAFPPEGGNRWLIVTDRAYFARNIPDECYDRLGTMWRAGARPACVAFPPPGGNRWAILAGKSFYCRGIDDECFQTIGNFAQGLRPAVRVAFTPSNGWVVLARDRYFARRIPDECYAKMGEIDNSFEVDHVNFETDGGWSIIANTPRTALPADPVREFEARIVQVAGDWKSVTERMATYKVPGIAVGIVRNNQVTAVLAYGRVESGSAHWVHVDTAFQAASCSKPVAALGFLQLAQDGLVGLDENVNPKLGWTLPRRSCAPLGWLSKVTLRRLLQHRGGIIGRGATNPTASCSNFDDGGGGGGFGGYQNVSGVGVPTVREILDGSSSRPGVTVNSHRVELTYDPGTMGAYSGEGYVLMMQLLQEQRDTTFNDWMQAHVLAPAGMTRSTYSLVAPTHSGPPATGHDGNGIAITGRRNRYPEGAAAGLYTTAGDLARFIIAVNQGGTIGGNDIIDSTRYQAMMSDALGMPTANLGTSDETYWHGGSNAGFKCLFQGFPQKRAGYVILTNGDGGDELYPEIQTALIRSFGWQ